MKIRVKLISFILLVLIAPILIINIAAGNMFNDSNMDIFLSGIEHAVENQADDFNFICESMSSQAKEFTLSEAVRRYTKAAAETDFEFDPENDDYIQSSRELKCISEYGESVIKAMLVGQSGIVLASTSENDLGRRLDNYKELFSLALENNGYSGFFMSSENNSRAPVFIVTKSIYSESNERIGILYAIYDTEYLQKFLNDMKLDKYTAAAIMDSDGNILEYPFKKVKSYSESNVYSIFSEELNRIVISGGESSVNINTMISIGKGKNEKLLFVSPISNSGWYLLSLTEKHGLKGAVGQTSSTVHWISFLLSAALGTLAIIFSFKFLNPVEEIINVFTEKQKGNQNARFNIKTNDEFKHIAHAFNSMFDNIFESEQRYRTIVEMTNNITFEINYKKGTVFVSKNFNKKFSFRPKDDTLQESFIYKLRIHKDDQQRFASDIERLLGPATFLQGEYRVKSIYGDFIWIMIKATKFFDRSDAPTKIIGVIVDIDREKKSEMNLIQKASYDNLTQLYNRETFIKSLAAQFEVSSVKKSLDAVMFIDLDDFKYFNDKFGHACGDEVLKFVADTMKEISFDRGFGGRFGGDEFVLCITNLTLYGDAGKTAQEIIDVLGKGFISESTGQKLSIKCSIGIAFLRESGKTTEEIIAAADEAMYNIKKHGKSAYAYAKSGGAPITVPSHINEIESDTQPVEHSSSRYSNYTPDSDYTPDSNADSSTADDFNDPIM